jgi:DNA-binding HxlR family transcriptional regulator
VVRPQKASIGSNPKREGSEVVVHGFTNPLATGVCMKTIIQIIGLTGTVEILKYLSKHETVSYSELMQFTSIATLNKRLTQLIHYRLIEHHFEIKGRKEWYTITEKGIEALELIEKLILLTS